MNSNIFDDLETESKRLPNDLTGKCHKCLNEVKVWCYDCQLKVPKKGDPFNPKWGEKLYYEYQRRMTSEFYCHFDELDDQTKMEWSNITSHLLEEFSFEDNHPNKIKDKN